MTSTTTELDLLDCPVAALDHADAYVRGAMQWHFGRDTGSRFWLDAADELPFDPLHDITGVADLQRFPDLTDRLRTTSMADLIPRGYLLSDLVGVYESGGTTGAPKRVLLDRGWLQAMTERNNATVAAHGFERGRDWLGVLPSGPHLVGEFFRDSVRTYGRLGFTVDLDPRWVRGRIAAGDPSAANAYAEHVVDQAEDILRTQDIGVLVTTPALLERFAARDELVAIMNDRLSGIRWGGTHLDVDSLDVYRNEIFPDVAICGNYGSTTFVGFNGQRVGTGGEPVFDSPAAGLVLGVVDDDRRPVAYGQRGRVLAHHLSRAMLIPSNLERDTAVRVASENGVGDAVSEVSPLGAVGDVDVVEGVY